jgi:hypothetical protein
LRLRFFGIASLLRACATRSIKAWTSLSRLRGIRQPRRTLLDISAQRGMTLSELIGAIDNDCQQGNLSSAIPLFVRPQADTESHKTHI